MGAEHIKFKTLVKGNVANQESTMTNEERNIQIEFIHNVYKDENGIRPRHIDFDSMSDDELDQAVEDMFHRGEDFAPTTVNTMIPSTFAVLWPV